MESDNVRRGALMAGHGFLLLHIATLAGDWRAFDTLELKARLFLSGAGLAALIGIGMAYLALSVQTEKAKLARGYESVSVGLFCLIAGVWLGALLPEF